MIAVTGATGPFGHHAVETLLARGVPATEIVAAVRTPEKAADLAARGVEVRRADYDDPATLATAFEGVDRLLFVSSNEVGRRESQHRNVVDAARAAGVSLIAYSSVLNGDRTRIQLADDHKFTERVIRESGLPFVFLRNGWYIENYTGRLPGTLEHGAVLGSAGDGRLSAATRNDLAEAAAAVVAEDGHDGRIYELGGEPAFTLSELADEISRQSGRAVVYRDLPEDDYVQVLLGAGLPEGYARMLADSDLGIARGDLFTDSGDLARLLGRPPTSLSAALAEVLARGESAATA